MNNSETASNPLCNVWISASAGSGKTKLLTDRVLRLLLSGVAPSKILCLTYTKAAASEMMQRINAELSKWAILDQTNLKERIRLLTGSIPNQTQIKFARTLLIMVIDAAQPMKIQTIHSFCQSIIAKFPIESGINLETKIIDDYQRQILLEQAKLSLLKNHDSNLSQGSKLDPLLNNIHEFSFHSLVENANSYRHKLANVFQENNIASYVYEKLSVDRNLSTDKILDDFFCSYELVISRHKNLINLCLLENQERFLLNLLEISDSESNEKQNLFWQIYNIFYTLNNSPRKKLLDAEIIKNYNLEDFISEIRNFVANYLELRNSYKIAENTSSFIYLASLVNYYYEDLKQENAFLDYDDLINITLKLLNSNELLQWVMFKLDNKIEHVLLDESQDISLEQWKIVTALTNNFFCELGAEGKPRTIFSVGDQKQSIFSFQGADPKLFNSIKDQYHEYINNFDAKLYTITLNKSFRSGIAILQAVDSTFNSLLQKNPYAFIGDINQHIAHKKELYSRVELWPAVLHKSNKLRENYDWQINADRIEVYDPAKILAKVLANEIKAWLDNSTSMQPGDILILIRKRDKFTEYLVRSLKYNNIPVSGLDRIKLSKNIVVKDLIAFGSFILLPYDDYNLGVLLKSPIINLSEDQLFKLSQRSGLSLWQNLKELALNDKKLFSIYSFLKEFLCRNDLQIYNLYNNLLDVKKIRQNIVARFGAQINEVLDEFLNICLEYEQTETMSLQHFISWFTLSDIEVKREIDNQANLVRIMTVHASKGLQAKVVILADTLSIPGSTKQVIWSDDFNLPLYNGNSQNNNQLYNDTRLSLEEKSLQEYYRLLYVAMTRAQERLIICGWSVHANINDKSWYGVIKSGLENIGHAEVCNSLGGYKIIKENQIDSSYYFYSNSLEKIIVGDELIDITESKLEEVINLENILPDFILEKPSCLQTKKFLSASNSISNEFIHSPVSKNSYTSLGTLIHKILEIGIGSNDESVISNLVETYNKYYDLAIDEKIANNLQNLINKLHFSFKSDYKIFTEVSLAVEYNKSNLIGTIDLLILGEKDGVVIDYKTSLFNKFEDIPVQYITQLAVYRYLVSVLHPNKKIKCFIVSSINGEFFEIAESILKENFINHVV